MEVRYEDYKKLIYKQAHKQKAINPSLELDELVSQGNLAFAEALATYDETKGAAFSTWLIYHFKSHVWGSRKAPEWLSLEDMPEEQLANTTNPPGKIFDWLHSLSKEAREVATIVLRAPQEIVESGCPKRVLKMQLLEQGWKWEQIWAVYRELKEEVRHI